MKKIWKVRVIAVITLSHEGKWTVTCVVSLVWLESCWHCGLPVESRCLGQDEPVLLIYFTKNIVLLS